MSEQQATETKQEEKTPTATICPCCGKPTLPYPPAKIPDALLDQFMACLISGQPFAHTYDMYDGRIKLTITQLTQEAREAVVHCIQAIDSLDDHGVKLDGVLYDNLKGCVRTLISVQQIDIVAGSTRRTYTPASSVMLFAKSLEGIQLNDTEALTPVVRDGNTSLTSPETISAMPPVQILAAVEAHARLTDVLLDAGFGPSFWKGIELA